jgi:hypothetical protein
MNKQQVVRVFAIATVALLGPLLSASIALGDVSGAGDKPSTVPAPWMGPVPKAICGPGDRTESGLQGQTTPEERSSGDSTRGYNCNLELVGQYQGEGAYSQDGPAYADDCGYYATDNITPQQKHHGVVVVDASDSRHPKPTTYLDDTPAMLSPHETLKHNDRRNLLAAGEFNGPGFAVYDTSADCRYPARKANIELEGSSAHMGNFAPDGLTYYLGQSNRGIGGFLYIVDLSHPS